MNIFRTHAISDAQRKQQLEELRQRDLESGFDEEMAAWESAPPVGKEAGAPGWDDDDLSEEELAATKSFAIFNTTPEEDEALMDHLLGQGTDSLPRLGKYEEDRFVSIGFVALDENLKPVVPFSTVYDKAKNKPPRIYKTAKMAEKVSPIQRSSEILMRKVS